MSAVGAAQLPHSRPSGAASVGPQLLILQGGSLLISQLTSVSTGCSTIRRLVDAGGSSHSSVPEHTVRLNKK